MTVSIRNAPLARAACAGPRRRQDSAPALFRLLADSALSRAALAACGAAVAIVDAEDPGWPVAHLNPAFERLFGHRECDVRGQSLVALVLGRTAELQSRLLEAMHGPQEISALHKNGAQLEVDLVLGPVHDSSGRLTHWVVTFTDCSERARLRAELSMQKKPLRVA
ncbi:MAG: PAS domain-containing protein [Burkholderiales bacterium]|nr:PAS domain-containing protein [Burkholderiales bacterium]